MANDPEAAEFKAKCVYNNKMRTWYNYHNMKERADALGRPKRSIDPADIGLDVGSDDDSDDMEQSDFFNRHMRAQVQCNEDYDFIEQTKEGQTVRSKIDQLLENETLSI